MTSILFIFSGEFNVFRDRKGKTAEGRKRKKKKKEKGKVDEKGLSTLEKGFKFNRYISARKCIWQTGIRGLVVSLLLYYMQKVSGPEVHTDERIVVCSLFLCQDTSQRFEIMTYSSDITGEVFALVGPILLAKGALLCNGHPEAPWGLHSSQAPSKALWPGETGGQRLQPLSVQKKIIV